MPRFAHVIFDLDGTVADTQADLAAATNYMLKTLGMPALPPARVQDYVGHGVRVLVGRALGPANGHLVDRGCDLFMAYYQRHLLDASRAYPGVAQLLAAARARGQVLSVLTNKPEAPSRALLAGLRLAPFFTAVVGGDTLPAKKPDPRGIFYLQCLTGIAPERTLLVGDSSVDVESGRAAGVATCGVTWGYGARSFAALSPLFVVDTPGQLHDLLCQ
jgi:phosphoglycolate phosphatase